jgi:AraC family transcriptional regulator
MQRYIRGVSSDSCIYFHTPSQFAASSLFYIESCGHFYCDSTYSCVRRDTDNIQILYLSDGRGTLNYDDKSYTINAGDCFIIDCNIPHSYYARDYWETWWCHINGLSTWALYEQIFERNGPTMTLSGTTQIPFLLDSIIRSGESNLFSNEAEISCYIHQILFEALMHSTHAATVKESPVSLARKYIHNNFRSKITLQDLCDVSYTSMYYLSRLFKRATGFSPYEYITTLRMNEAKKLLISTNMTIKEIADEIGYASESNFIRIFSSYIKSTPGQFRKSLL